MGIRDSRLGLPLSRPALAVVLATAVVVSIESAGGGLGNHCEQADCAMGIRSSAGSTLVAFALIALLSLWNPPVTGVDVESRVGIWRRAGAFLVDFALIGVAVGPVSLLPLLFHEAVETGQFQWTFERRLARPSDAIFGFLSVVGVLVGFYLYDYWCTSRHQATFGSYVLGYKLARAQDSQGEPDWITRPLLSFVGMCWWPVSVLVALARRDGQFWWDRQTGTRALRLALDGSRRSRSDGADRPGPGGQHDAG